MFSGAGALGTALGGPIVGAAAGFSGDLIGGLLQQGNSAQQVQQIENYQTQMSDTAYQRGTASMEAAGINPILAAGGASASTPSGAMYQPQNILGQATSSALDTAQRSAQIDATKAGQANTEQDTTNKEFTSQVLSHAIDEASADARTASNNADVSDITTKFLKENPTFVKLKAAMGGATPVMSSAMDLAKTAAALGGE